MKLVRAGLFVASFNLVTGAADAASLLDTIIANVNSHLDDCRVSRSGFTCTKHHGPAKKPTATYETSSAKSTVLDVNSSVAIAAGSARPVGQWIVDDGDRRVQIGPCGNALCGFISSAKSDAVDRYNPDPARRNRTILSLPVLIDMRQTETNRWEGQIYNTNDGKTYYGKIAMRDDNLLDVDGDAPLALLRQTWVKDAAEGN